MMASTAWVLVQHDPTWKGTDVDRYVRQEYGGPNASWLLSADASTGVRAEPDHEGLSRESRFRRFAQAISAFF